MELVEGPTLADVIERRGGSSDPPIPIDEALPFARQIAEALEAAHEQGVSQRVASIAPELDGSVELVSLFAVDADDVYVGIKDRSRDR